MNALEGEFILNGGQAETISQPSESANSPKPQAVVAKNRLHFYSSYFKNPVGITFGEQEENETILLLLRRHFVTNVPWIATTVVLLLLPFIFPFVLRFFPFPLPEQQTIMLFMGFYYLVILGFVILNFTLWYFQAGLVTTIRVIDVDLSGILYRQISEAKIQNIEDVTYNQSGFIRSLFNYGNVLVQTAGTSENIEYDRVPRPSRVAEIVGDLSQGV